MMFQHPLNIGRFYQFTSFILEWKFRPTAINFPINLPEDQVTAVVVASSLVVPLPPPGASWGAGGERNNQDEVFTPDYVYKYIYTHNLDFFNIIWIILI